MLENNIVCQPILFTVHVLPGRPDILVAPQYFLTCSPDACIICNKYDNYHIVKILRCYLELSFMDGTPTCSFPADGFSVCFAVPGVF
jgi:hypothetical protein